MTQVKYKSKWLDLSYKSIPLFYHSTGIPDISFNYLRTLI